MTQLDIPVSSIPLTGGVVTGIPELNQLNEPTQDGAADENNRDNCVFTCDAMLSRFYHPELNADGDAVKDSIPAYGQGYVGFSSQDTIIVSGVLEKRWGIRSWRLEENYRADLLKRIIALADQGTPSIITIPSMWGSQPNQPGYDPDHPNFYTHACVFAGTLADGTCVLVNPWGGFLMYYSQADLALRLCYLCAYPVAKATAPTGVPTVIVIDHDSAGNVTGGHDDQNGKTIGAGFALAIQQQGWQSAHVRVQERPSGHVQVAVADAATFVFTPEHGVEFVNIPDIADAVTAAFDAVDAAQNQLASSQEANKALKAANDTLAQQLAAAQQNSGSAVDHQIAVGLKSLIDLSAQVK